MSMRRVSSRPRLVSDADRASQISSFMEENHLDTSSAAASLDSDSYFFGHDDNDDVKSSDQGGVI